jgi:diguanylate cyclase (GGDEF)-like protein
MKKLVLLWLCVFILASVSIAYTFDYLISPLWVVNPFCAYFLIKLRKISNSLIFQFLFSFSAIFLASYICDPVKDLDIKVILCAISAFQIVAFIKAYYYLKAKVSRSKYSNTIFLIVPSIVSSMLGGLAFMLMIDQGKNYFEFIDYFLEQFSTGLGVICFLYGIHTLKNISWGDYGFVLIALVFQYFISVDRIFYACLILPFLMCYFAMKHTLKTFSFLIGLMTLICTMYVSLPLAGEYWSDDQVHMLARISAYRLALGVYLIIFLIVCEIYISNRRLYKDFQRMMFSDELTGLKNRRFIREKVLSDAKFKNGFLLLLDIDDFKNVNDMYGHYIGDLVLQHMSDILRQIENNTKVISRWGGEEFLVVVPSGSQEDCQAYCERVLTSCETMPFIFKDIQFHVTFSIGATNFEAFNNNTYEMLIQKVDKFLYEAKANGKKQYVFS